MFQKTHGLALMALITAAAFSCLAGAASAQTENGSVRNMMHCGLRPPGVTEAECLEYAARMAYEWVAPPADLTYARSLGLKTIQWTGNGYGPASFRSWVVDVDFPKWAARCPIDTYACFHTPYWLCLQSADARAAALQDMDTRLHKWSQINALFFDSASLTICTKCRNVVNCTNPAHVHQFDNIVDGKAAFIGEVRDQAHAHGMPLIANIWDGRDWVNTYMSRTDYAAFEPDTFYVETGPLAWGSIFDYIPGDRLVFQARDRQGVSLKYNASEYLECATTIAIHGAWFGYQNHTTEPEDPPVFSNCSAEINLLRTFPNWENLNGAVSRQLLYPSNLARNAAASSTLSVYNGRTPSKANDGVGGVNLNDGWTGGARQGTLELTFGSPVTIKCIRITFGDFNVRGINYQISGLSGSTWRTLVSVSSNAKTILVHDLSTATTVSKLRYTCTKSAHSSMVYLQEIEAYSDNPLTAQEYRSEFSLASKSMVYSIHPRTAEAFVVFKDPTATFDWHRNITAVRRATSTWADNGDGRADVLITGTSMRLRLSKPAGSAFIVSF